MKKEIRRLLTIILMRWSFSLCPDGKFKEAYSLFIAQNIDNL